MNGPAAEGGQPEQSVFDLDFAELRLLLAGWGEPDYRALQLWQGLYHRLAASPDELTTLPRPLRQRLEAGYHFSSLHPAADQASRDGHTRKTLFSLAGGGEALHIETVSMHYDQRRTLCISSQAGCAMGCVFCATGQMGFRRNLTSGQIVEQVLYFARLLQPQGEKITNIVVMGMGEPFHNYDATFQAIDRLNDPQGFNFGARRFTVSTVGLVPGIRRFTAERRQVNLAISLHAATDELRSQLLPVNKKYPLVELMKACREYVEATHRRISFEWALIQGLNDSPDQARRLAALLTGFQGRDGSLAHVNMIPLNPTHKYAGQAATRQSAAEFQTILEQAGISCTIRVRRGIDIQAGCGQLAARRDPALPIVSS